MKYHASLPLTALAAVLLIALLVENSIIPPGLTLLESLQDYFGQAFYLLIFLIILLESIVYVGFYFPGQFFAVVLVVLSKPNVDDVVFLTVAMVIAATCGSIINFLLGKAQSAKTYADPPKIKIKQLLLAMIHINSLAFFMFSQGAKKQRFRIVWLAGVLNFPYYLLLIALTATLSDEIMQIAESTWLLASIIGVWLLIALITDVRHHQQSKRPSH